MTIKTQINKLKSSLPSAIAGRQADRETFHEVCQLLQAAHDLRYVLLEALANCIMDEEPESVVDFMNNLTAEVVEWFAL